MSANPVTVKFHLVTRDFKTIEIQKVDIPYATLYDYKLLTDRVAKMFADLSKKSFKIYWTDEENDNVAIPSQEALETALKEMLTKVKVFYVMAKNSTKQSDETEVETDCTHPNVFCDGCESLISGYRYKCLICNDYDLCSECEQETLHPEHPMLRISTPLHVDKIDLCKLMRYFSIDKFESKHSRHRRRHSHDHSASHKKKRYEKFEPGLETGEESDENRRKKFSYYRSSTRPNAFDVAMKVISTENQSLGACGDLINDILKNIHSAQGDKQTPKADSQEQTNEEKKEEPIHLKDFKSLVKTFVSVLDPLGIDVNVEVRPGCEEGANQSKTEKKEEEKQEQTKTSPKRPSAPMAKEARQETQEPRSQTETIEKKVEEITKILANQKMGQIPENDDWVCFEELEKNPEEPQPSTSAEVNSKVNTEEQTTQAEKPKEGNNLYPSLTPLNGAVADSLKKMLALGFSNEGDWLSHLLEAKNGDIVEVLKVLSPHKK